MAIPSNQEILATLHGGTAPKKTGAPIPFSQRRMIPNQPILTAYPAPPGQTIDFSKISRVPTAPFSLSQPPTGGVSTPAFTDRSTPVSDIAVGLLESFASGSLAQSIARSMEETGETLVQSIASAVTRGKIDATESIPENALTRVLYGEGDIEPVPLRVAEMEMEFQNSENPLVQRFATPLAFSLGTIFSSFDLTPFGGTTKGVIKAIRTAKTEGEALSILTKIGLDEDLARFYAQDVVRAGTDEEARNLFEAIVKAQIKTTGTKGVAPQIREGLERVAAKAAPDAPPAIRASAEEMAERLRMPPQVSQEIRENAARVAPRLGIEPPPVRPTKAAEAAPDALRAEIAALEETAAKLQNDVDRGMFKSEEAMERGNEALGEALKKLDELKKQLAESEKKPPAKREKLPAEEKGEPKKEAKDVVNPYSKISAGDYFREYKGTDSANKFIETGKTLDKRVEEIKAGKNIIASAENENFRLYVTKYKGGSLGRPTFFIEDKKTGRIVPEMFWMGEKEDAFNLSDEAWEKLPLKEKAKLEAQYKIDNFYKNDKGFKGRAEDADWMKALAEVAEQSDATPKKKPATKEEARKNLALKFAKRLETAMKKDPEVGSLERLAEQQSGSDFVLNRSKSEEERVVSNLESIFADMKGIDLEDAKLRFSAQELEEAKAHYEILMDSLIDDPARALVRYRSKTTGKLPEVTGKETMKALTGSGKTVRTSEFGRRGDDIVDELGFKDADEAQKALDAYLERREQAGKVLEEMREIAKNIRLSKQKDAFIGTNQKKLARDLRTNLNALKTIVEAAERAGFRQGYSKGNQRYQELVKRLKTRRGRLTAIRRAFNLTDSQMRKVRGPKDPRFMDENQFTKYIEEVRARAELEFKRDQEKLLIEDMINTKELKKTENLQRALEFPPVKDMNLDQLVEFASILAKTEADDTFLGPRMIQTAKNTDLGNIRTIGEGRAAVSKQTGMPYGEGVAGSKLDRWLRDPTLVERDPLHKLFIGEWSAKEADMLTRKYALNREINTLARAARRSRRKAGTPTSLRERFFSRLVPQDSLVVKWLQPYETTYVEGKDGELVKRVVRVPELRARAESMMTPEELKYAQYLEKLFSHYYNVAASEALQRWTLLGVKHTNYRSMYFPHIKRGFFEKWRDEGIMRAFGTMWEKNRAETKIDFNAFGDRGEVLGFEKWFNNNMTRQGEGEDAGKLLYSSNTAKVALSYFHAFERKLIIDSMTPKIKLLEFLMGKRFETPKSVSNPEGTEKVHSILRRSINEWINNKKGQRIEIAYEQGDRAESVVDALRTFIAVQHLGANIIAQVISGFGGEALTLSGLGIRGWAKGHTRAVTEMGRKMGVKYSGIIGDPPWNALASAANDAGDTLRSGLFYIFGDLAFRARRQMFLGLLSDDEFAKGVVSAKRAGELKLQIGKWHQMPEFRSVAGSTSLVKAATMYTEWALPVLENTYFNILPKVWNMARSAGPDKWQTLAKSEEFKQLTRLLVSGAGLGSAGYMIFNPDENDHTNLGYARRKAAQEVGTILQAMTTWGLPIPFSVFIGYLEQVKNALGTMMSLERYETAGPGHKAGDLKGPAALGRALIPRALQQLIPEPETPLETEDDIKADLKRAIESGEMTVSAAKEKFIQKMESLEKKRRTRRFELAEDEYKKDLKERILNKEITVADAKKEFSDYLKQKKERDPESFESDSEASFVDKVKAYAEAIGTDPVTAFARIFQGQIIRRTDNGQIIVERMTYEASQEIRRQRGATQELMLDHTIPLQLGGTNLESNLKLIPMDEWERYTPVENFLGMSLRNGDIDGETAQKLIRDFKEGRITEAEVYSEVERSTERQDVSYYNRSGGGEIEETEPDLAKKLLRAVTPFGSTKEERWVQDIKDRTLSFFPFTALARGELADTSYEPATFEMDGQETGAVSGRYRRRNKRISEAAREVVPEVIADMIEMIENKAVRPQIVLNEVLSRYDKIDETPEEVADYAQGVMAHEMLHRLFDLSPSGEEMRNENTIPLRSRWLDDWDRLSAKYPILFDIDKHIADSGYDYANAELLSTERFAYLGQAALHNKEAIPPELRKYYLNVIDF